MDNSSAQDFKLSLLDCAKFCLLSFFSHKEFYESMSFLETSFDADKIIDKIKLNHHVSLSKSDMPIFNVDSVGESNYKDLTSAIEDCETKAISEIIKTIDVCYEIRIKMLYYKILLPFCQSENLINQINQKINDIQHNINDRTINKSMAFNIFKQILSSNPVFEVRFRKMCSELKHLNLNNPHGLKILIALFETLCDQNNNNINNAFYDNNQYSDKHFNSSEIAVLNNFFNEVNVKLISENKETFSSYSIKKEFYILIDFIKLIHSKKINKYSVSQYYSEFKEKLSDFDVTINKNIRDFNFFDRFLFFNSLIDELDILKYKHFGLTNSWIEFENLKSFNDISKKTSGNNIKKHKLSIPIIELSENYSSDDLLNSCFEDLMNAPSDFTKQIYYTLDYYILVSDDELSSKSKINTLQTNDDKFNDKSEKEIISFGFKVNSSFELAKYYEYILLEYGKSHNNKENIQNADDIVKILKADDFTKFDKIRVLLPNNVFLMSLVIINHHFDNMKGKSIESCSRFLPFSNSSAFTNHEYNNFSGDINNIVGTGCRITVKKFNNLNSFSDKCNHKNR